MQLISEIGQFELTNTFDLFWCGDDQYVIDYGYIPIVGSTINYKIYDSVIEFSPSSIGSTTSFEIDCLKWYNKINQMSLSKLNTDEVNVYDTLDVFNHTPFEILQNKLFIGDFFNMDPNNEVDFETITTSFKKVYQTHPQTEYKELVGYSVELPDGPIISFDPRRNHSDEGYYDQYLIKLGSSYILGGCQYNYYSS
jgi:hypothetical protein